MGVIMTPQAPLPPGPKQDALLKAVADDFTEKGLEMNSVPASRTPWWAMASSV